MADTFEYLLPEYSRRLQRLSEIKAPSSKVPSEELKRARADLTDIEYRIAATLYKRLKGEKMPRDDKLIEILTVFRTSSQSGSVHLHAAIIHVFKNEKEYMETVDKFALRIRTARPETLGAIGKEIDGLMSPIESPLVSLEKEKEEEERIEPNTMAARKYGAFIPKGEIDIVLPPSMTEKHVQLEEGETSIMRELLGRVFPQLNRSEQPEFDMCSFAYTLTNLRAPGQQKTLTPEFREILGSSMNLKVCVLLLKSLLMWDSKGTFINNILTSGTVVKKYIADVFTSHAYSRFNNSPEFRLRLAEVFLRQLIKQRVDRPLFTSTHEFYKGYGMMQNVFLCSSEMQIIFGEVGSSSKMFTVTSGEYDRFIKTGRAELVYRSTVYWRELGMAVRIALPSKDEHKKWCDDIGRAYTKIFHAAMKMEHIPHIGSMSDLNTERVKKAVASYPKIADDDVFWRILVSGNSINNSSGVRVDVNGFYVMPETREDGVEETICKEYERAYIINGSGFMSIRESETYIDHQ